MQTAYKFIGLALAVVIAAFLYNNIQERSVLGCVVDPGTVKLTNTAGVFGSTKEIGEEVFAKYLEAHHIGSVCSEAVISSYRIDNVVVRKDNEESFVARVTFDVAPLNTASSLWFEEGTPDESYFIKNIVRDFIVKKEADVYSILDVIEQ